ncbi:MAG: NIPSNAP family protein [bacterium]
MLNKVCLAIMLSLCSLHVLAEDAPLYEMRTYTTNEGKLDALHERFRNHTMRIFEKHGMQNVGYWIPADTPETLIYIIAHQDSDAAQASWQAFVADPEWQDVYAKSIADGRLVKNIVSVFMTKTDYSP